MIRAGIVNNKQCDEWVKSPTTTSAATATARKLVKYEHYGELWSSGCSVKTLTTSQDRMNRASVATIKLGDIRYDIAI